MRNKVALALIIVCFLCFFFIFFNSSQVSSVSNARSHKVVNQIVSVIPKTNTGQMILESVSKEKCNLIIRKIAHGFEFFLFAFMLCVTLKYFKVNAFNTAVYSLFIILCIAVLDEFFQIFIQDRNSNVIDIIIDFCGGICANLLFFTFYKIKDKYFR